MNSFIYLILAFLTNGAANVLLKVGADRGVTLDWSLGFAHLLKLHAYLLGGLGLFMLNVIFYVLALRGLPLSIAYPVMVGMSFVLASTAAFLFLHESIAWQQIIGYLLILGGITLAVAYGK
jgi:multidrug transporter EmrE-like cation transporter